MAIVSILIVSLLITPFSQIKAANYEKTWSSTDDFNTGTNTNIDTANNEAKLPSTTTNFNEGFANTTYKDAATDANWDTAANKVTLPGDPANGVTTDMTAAWNAAVGANENIKSSTHDSINHFVYLGGSLGSFVAYNPANGTSTSLTSKISTNWSASSIYALTFDSTNGKVYLGGGSGKFGVYAGGSDPANGTWVYLASKISADWSTNNINALTFDSTNGKVYLGGDAGKFGVYTGGSDPANGTWVYLTSKISADWSSSYYINALTFDLTNGKVYLGGDAGKFGVYTGGSDPANGTWTYLNSKISATWSTGYNIVALTFDSTNNKVYLGGTSGKFGVYTGGSDPANGTWFYLASKISADWSTNNINALTFDSTNGKVYLGGSSGKLGVFTGGADPANGTWVYLTAKISGTWLINHSYSLFFDSINGKVYLGGEYGKFGSFTGGADPANGTWTYLLSSVAGGFRGYAIRASVTDTINNIVYLGGDGPKFAAYLVSSNTMINLTTKISSDWPNNYPILALVFDKVNSIVYIGGWNGKFGTFSGGSDPTSGTWLNLSAKVSAVMGNGIYSLVIDTINTRIYLGGYGTLSTYTMESNPANGVFINLTSKISANWSNSTVYSLVFDSINGKLYLGGSSGAFGVFTGGADPANGTWAYLNSKILSDWGNNDIYALTFDSTNSKVYLGGGQNGKFGVFTGGADPSNGTWIYLTAKISATWSSNVINALIFYNNKIFIGGNLGNFGVFTGGADPANGTWTYLTSNISTFWSTNIVYSIIPVPSTASVYLGGALGKMASYTIGYTSNKNGLSVAVDSTTQPVASVTLTATETKPANTVITYYVSNNGGTNWTAVTSGVSLTFSTVGSDLRWKANLTTTDVAVTPSVDSVALAYSYFATNSGTLSLILDATQAVTPTLLTATSTLPTNTTLTFKIRTASTSGGLSSAIWSDTKSAAESPINLKTINIGGTPGVVENQFSEIQIDFATSDGINTPVLSDITEQYVINATPEVQALTAIQALDGSKVVNIGYQLRDTDTLINPYNTGKIAVSFKYSIDSGTNWLDCTTVTNTGLKDVSQTDFTPYTSAWNIGTDLSASYYSGTVKIKALIDDNEQAHNTAELVSSAFSIDTKNPVAGAMTGGGVGIKVNDGSSWVNSTSVDLSFLATDDSAKYMEVRNDTSFTGVKEDYAATKTGWTPTVGDGAKTISVRFYDAFGNYTDANSNVLLDTTAPDMPTHFTLFDGSDMQLGIYQSIIVWNRINDPGDFTQYSLERAINGTWTELATFSNIASDVYSDKGLSSTITYSYRLRAKDIHTNYSTYTDIKSLKPAGADTVAPEITGTGPTPEATDVTATISWTTDKPSDSYVEYGITTGYGQMQGADDLVVNHVVTLVGLSPTTTYQFRVKCRDVSANRVVSANASFTTTLSAEAASGVTITGSTAQKPGADPEEVTIIWTTDRYSTSQVKYGTDSKNLDMITEDDGVLNKTHYVLITHLNQNTKYYYQAYSKDTYDNKVLGELKYFVTAQSGLEIPTIMSVESSDLTLTSVIISWQTTTVATSVVEIGTKAGVYSRRIEDKSLGSTTQHVVRIPELDNGKVYHYRVLGSGSDGLWVSSDDYVFTTIPMPAISEIEVKEISSVAAIVSWNTNIEIVAMVNFGAALNDAGATGKLDQSQGDTIPAKIHSVSLRALEPATKYNFQIKATDNFGNIVLSDLQTFKTIVDTAPPEINDIKSEVSIITDPNGGSKAQAIVSWSTNEPATSQVKYTMGVASADDYSLKTQEESGLSTSHIVIIADLQPSATYHIRLVSKDLSGNIGVSDDYTVLTLNQEKSLLQYVTQILEDKFFWLKSYSLF